MPTCSVCKQNVNVNALQYVDGDFVCKRCVKRFYVECEHCGKLIYKR